jgi:small subunit ribosomal protein S26e
MVPRDKAKKATVRPSFLNPVLAKELRKQGAYISVARKTKYYCISCAVHRGIVKVRAEDKRRTAPRKRRRR